jgi:hypothetical protein
MAMKVCSSSGSGRFPVALTYYVLSASAVTWVGGSITPGSEPPLKLIREVGGSGHAGVQLGFAQACHVGHQAPQALGANEPFHVLRDGFVLREESGIGQP